MNTETGFPARPTIIVEKLTVKLDAQQLSDKLLLHSHYADDVTLAFVRRCRPTIFCELAVYKLVDMTLLLRVDKFVDIL